MWLTHTRQDVCETPLGHLQDVCETWDNTQVKLGNHRDVCFAILASNAGERPVLMAFISVNEHSATPHLAPPERNSKDVNLSSIYTLCRGTFLDDLINSGFHRLLTSSGERDCSSRVIELFLYVPEIHAYGAVYG